MYIEQFILKTQDIFSTAVIDMLGDVKGEIPGSSMGRVSITVRHEPVDYLLGRTEPVTAIVSCEAEVQVVVPSFMPVGMDLDRLRDLAVKHGIGPMGDPQMVIDLGRHMFSFSVGMKTGWVDGIDGVEVGADVVRA